MAQLHLTLVKLTSLITRVCPLPPHKLFLTSAAIELRVHTTPNAYLLLPLPSTIDQLHPLGSCSPFASSQFCSLHWPPSSSIKLRVHTSPTACYHHPRPSTSCIRHRGLVIPLSTPPSPSPEATDQLHHQKHQLDRISSHAIILTASACIGSRFSSATSTLASA